MGLVAAGGLAVGLAVGAREGDCVGLPEAPVDGWQPTNQGKAPPAAANPARPLTTARRETPAEGMTSEGPAGGRESGLSQREHRTASMGARAPQ